MHVGDEIVKVEIEKECQGTGSLLLHPDGFLVQGEGEEQVEEVAAEGTSKRGEVGLEEVVDSAGGSAAHHAVEAAREAVEIFPDRIRVVFEQKREVGEEGQPDRLLGVHGEVIEQSMDVRGVKRIAAHERMNKSLTDLECTFFSETFLNKSTILRGKVRLLSKGSGGIGADGGIG